MKKLILSFKNAGRGVLTCIKEERNFVIHIIAAAVVIILALAFSLSLISTAILLIMCALVITAEMINTAIENLCDLITKDMCPEIKKIKDISSGAVLILAAAAVVVGIIIIIIHV